MAEPKADLPPETPAAEQELLPPEERFWVKYSPNHELPVSSVSSIALHALVIGLLILIGFVLSQYRQQQRQPVQQDAVEIAGGGGLDGDSTGTGSGGNTVGERTEQVEKAAPRAKTDTAPPQANLKAPETAKTPIDVPKTPPNEDISE